MKTKKRKTVGMLQEIFIAMTVTLLCLGLTYRGTAGNQHSRNSSLAQAHAHLFASSIKNLYDSPGSLDTKVNNLTPPEIRHFVHTIYDAFEEDPSVANDSLSALNKEVAMVESSKSVRSKPSFLYTYILKRAENELSPLVTSLIRLTYIVQARVVSIKNVTSIDSVDLRLNMGRQIPATLVEIVVGRVLKGTSTVQPSDTIQFFYREFWRKRVPFNFQVGKEYILPLERRERGLIGLVMFLDYSEGYYPMEDGSIDDPYQLFELDKRISIDQLNEKLQQTIQQIKSW